MDVQKIRTLIVDDEPLARDGIRTLLEPHDDIQIIGECATGVEAVAAIRKTAPDLVFLDVQMPEMNGFEVLGKLSPEEMPLIIFVTAYDQYSLRAFEVHAVDYLLKPYDDERFERALDHARGQLRQRQVQQLSHKLVALVQDYAGGPAPEERGTAKQLQRLAIRSAGRVVFVKTEEIDWVEAADYYVKLHSAGAEHLLRESMNSLEERLDPEQFLRIHRSTIVNLDKVRELRADPHGEHLVVLHDGTRLRLSKGRKEKLKELLDRS